MKIFSKSDELYDLQEAWNKLDAEEALAYSQYELEDNTEYDAEEWKNFLKDGQVAKYLNEELELYKQSQMRKLIQRSTTNDKSVGTAQMLNAIGKTMEEDQTEQSFFIYSYVPPTPVEATSCLVRQESEWRPEVLAEEPELPEEVQEIIENSATEEIILEEVEEPKKEVKQSEWLF